MEWVSVLRDTMRDSRVYSRLSLAELPSRIGGWVARAGAYGGALCLALGGLALTSSACSSDGVTPACDEAQLFSNRYDDDDKAEHKRIVDSTPAGEEPQGLRALADNADQDKAKLAALANQTCVTAPGAIGAGTANCGSSSSGCARSPGGSRSSGGAGGAAGSN